MVFQWMHHRAGLEHRLLDCGHRNRVAVAVMNTPEYFDARADEYATSWGAAGWSEHGQQARFEAVLAELDLEPGESLFDFGGGTGALVDLLPDDFYYHHFDWSHRMRERCRMEHPTANVWATWPARKFDHAVAIGTFNLPGSYWRSDVLRLLVMVDKTLIVCFYRGDDPRCIKYDPHEILTMAQQTGLKWKLVGDYLPNDFMLVLRR